MKRNYYFTDMKITIQTGLWTMLLLFSNQSFSQTNSIPSSGNVGIGTTSPTTKLQVNGSARIDSMLMVKDSLVVNKTATIKSDLKVIGKAIIKSDLKVAGETTLIGTTVIKEGDLKIKILGDSTLADDGVLLINANGKVKNGGDLKSLVYAETQSSAQLPCASDVNGNGLYAGPYWQASANPQRMFLINTNCSPDPRLGVGVKPESKVHVRLSKDSELNPLVIDKTLSNNPAVPSYKLMQLDHTGLLYAREIKVNLNSWADYVFDAAYPLMPLSELKQYISQNKHLPNVPGANEMQEKGLNVAQSSIMLMEKVEELTLYLIEVKEQVDAQQELLKQQQETIRLQQELILQLQQQIKP
ncbi:hypothetical protein D3C71_585940 [compost metagenome]